MKKKMKKQKQNEKKNNKKNSENFGELKNVIQQKRTIKNVLQKYW